MIWAGFKALVPAVDTVDDVIAHLVSLDTLSRLVTAPRPVCQHESFPVSFQPHKQASVKQRLRSRQDDKPKPTYFLKSTSASNAGFANKHKHNHAC